MNKFVIIDGNAVLHRAFHALPPLTSHDGVLTNAVYGFFSMILKIIEDVKPEYFAVCFDRPKPTFRQALYAGYQQHRPKMDEGLVPQIELVHHVLRAAKIPIFEVDGYEADDLIGTLALQATEINTNTTNKYQSQISNKNKETTSFEIGNLKLEIIIVSGDRDLLQLVNSQVLVLAPVTGITKMILFDEQRVEEKFGIKAKQMIDYKALRGDASDGYPGVSGIGPKTAADLLGRYNTLESVYQNLEEIKKKNENLALKLAEGAEAAGLAKKLATIVKDAPVTLDIRKCEVGIFDEEKMKEEFEGLGFKSLIKRSNIKNQRSKTGAVDNKLEVQKQSEQLGFI